MSQEVPVILGDNTITVLPVGVRLLSEAKTSPSEPKALEFALTRCLSGELGEKLAPMLILGVTPDELCVGSKKDDVFLTEKRRYFILVQPFCEFDTLIPGPAGVELRNRLSGGFGGEGMARLLSELSLADV